MAIITQTKGGKLSYENISLYPDQYVSEQEKKSDDWIKSNMDYFSTIAHTQYRKNRQTISRNYELVKGIIRKDDFYEQPEVKNFIDSLEIEQLELPAYVKHYPILNPPLNTLIGELTKRPDTSRVKAFDQDSRNEQLQYRTDLLQQMILDKAYRGIQQKLSLQENENQITPEQIEELTLEKVEDYLTSYTTLAERWGSHVLEATKVQFCIKEKSEDAFRDLLITSSEFYHIYETQENSLGYSVETLNPVNVWKLTTAGKKYSRDWYAGGTIEVMELSEIMDRFSDITKEEIDHLRKTAESHHSSDYGRTTYGKRQTGINTIQYDTYNPAIIQDQIISGYNDAQGFFEYESTDRLYPGLNSWGNKFTVVISYWKSKIKVGKVTYRDETTGQIQSVLVDETYRKGTTPNEISLEWRYANRWYRGLLIGADVYHVAPYKLLPYLPIIGVTHELKNSRPTSLIDLMKPYQMIYNVCLNQLWKLLEKEKGKVILIPLRHIPIPKDGDGQDALDMWELEAKERGAIFIDDSPENARALSAFNQYSALDLSRTQEIQSRYNLALQMKMECWELVGLTRERLGNVAATQTATGVNTSLSQSYAQTEPYFTQHEYVLNELYQGMLDAAMYIESSKPVSTLSYINGDGENSFIQINGSELKLRDLKVFVTSRAKDQMAFQKLQELAQPALQNGASLYDIAELYTTDSMRKMKDTFRRLKNKQEEYLKNQQAIQQQQLTQQQEQFVSSQQAADERSREQMINDNYQAELDRINKKEIAIIATFNRQSDNLKDVNDNGTPDLLEYSRFNAEQQHASKDYNLAMQKINNERMKLSRDRDLQLKNLEIEKQKLKIKQEEIKSRERIAHINKNKFD